MKNPKRQHVRIRIRSIRSVRRSRHPKYAGRDCMVGHLDVPDMLRLEELREANKKTDDAYRSFREQLVAKVKKAEKPDVIEAGGDFATVDIDFYTGRKYLVTWYRFNPNDRRKGAKETKVVKEKK